MTPTQALELLWSNGSSSYGATVRSVAYPAPVPIVEEAADDFQFQGTVERLIIYGRNDTSVDFATDPPLAGEGFWFLVRVDPAGAAGTYDSGASGRPGCGTSRSRRPAWTVPEGSGGCPSKRAGPGEDVTRSPG